MSMQCPVCNAELQMTERQGVEIDYCPKCRGVWLDRGELDKIIERASVEQAPPARGTAPHPQHYDKRYRKPKSLLGEIFDF
jgi:hypothetical protein